VQYQFNPATGDYDPVEPEPVSVLDPATGRVIYADAVDPGVSAAGLGDLQAAVDLNGGTYVNNPPSTPVFILPMPQEHPGTPGPSLDRVDVPNTAPVPAAASKVSQSTWYIVAAVAVAAFLWWRFR